MTINDILNTMSTHPRLFIAVYNNGKILFIGSDRKMPEEIAEREVESFSIEKLINVNGNSKIARMRFYVPWQLKFSNGFELIKPVSIGF